MPGINNLLIGTATFLMDMADDIERWADQSLSGGWSTHQVEENRMAASKLRSQAAKLYREARK